MQPIANNLNAIKLRPTTGATGSGFTAGGSGFGTQLQSLLQKTQTPTQTAAPSRATTGVPLHAGGMNDAAHHLLKLAGKG